MSSESFSSPAQKNEDFESKRSSLFAQEFRELPHTQEQEVFDRLERDLADAGFTLATSADVIDIFNDNSLMTRSESFSKVLDLLLTNEPLAITGNGDANMCIIASGAGYKVAMEEGFSGRDVGGMVKTVITFAPDHLTSSEQIPQTHEVWRTKPTTAQVSRIGNGEVQTDDVHMVSFRFPIHYYPESHLTSDERELLEESAIRFVVRHYSRTKEKAVH